MVLIMAGNYRSFSLFLAGSHCFDLSDTSFVLQITTDDYKKNADSNAFLNKIQYPSRGAIYDRTGKLLVFNQPAYDITIVPRK